MEPLMPSEVARLVYGYLKEVKNDDTAECFLKSSPHLTECYQSFKANRKFNTKVNGFTLHAIFDIFGTICSMSNVLVLIKDQISEKCESKTLLEKLQCLLNENHISTTEDKFESFKTPKETYNILKGIDLYTPTLEKSLDSTQCDPQIKNPLDEFLVFDVDNAENDENTCTNELLNDSIKSRLCSTRNKDGCIDDVPSNIKKNIFNITKPIVYDDEDCMKVDNSVVLIHEESSDSYKFNPTREIIEPSHCTKTEYMKIIPKITSMSNNYQAPDRLIFPKQRKQSLKGPGIRSKCKKTNLAKQSLVLTTFILNQNSFENQERNHLEINDIVRLPEVSSKTDDVMFIHDTPDDRLKPPKNKSMSTPRRRSTHIRCLDFSTPQPKYMTRNEARSKLFYGTPNKIEKCIEEPNSSPLLKFQADWGSGNGFESMIKKEMMNSKKHQNSDIREIMGTGILTSNTDERKTTKKKTKPVNVKSIDLLKSSNNLITTNELHTDVSNISQNPYDVLTEQNSNRPLLDSQKPIKKQTKIPILLETQNNVTELYNKPPPIKSDTLKELAEFTISLETPDKITKLDNQQLQTTSKTLENTNNLKNPSEISISLETTDKSTELYTKQLLVESNSLKNGNNEKSLKSQPEFLIPSETPEKITKLNNKQQVIKFNSSKSQCTSQIILEQSSINLNEEKINQNQLINSFNLKIVSGVPNQEKDSNFSKIFNNHNNLLKENNSNKLTKHLKEQSLFDKKSIHNSSELNSPIKCNNTDPVKPKLFETPYKCDDAVNVPETPISKFIREYDPSKLVTPLPCTPEHYDDSLTETPLTKVFRETSYLNRPPISPFPPTPGNSISVTTLFIPQKQNYIKTSNHTTIKMNDSKEFITQPIQASTTDNKSSTNRKKEKIECTPLKSIVKLSTKCKIRNECKRKSFGAKKKQLCESVKIELFGNEISKSSNSKELFNTYEQHKTIVINPKPQEKEKKSGFKPIPKRKSIENKSVVNVNGIEKNLSNELNIQPTKTPFIKPILVQNENREYNSKKIKETISKTIKNSMEHFNDPEEKFIRLSKSPTPHKFNNKNTGKIQNKTTINDNSKQLIGPSGYLNKTPSKMFDSSPKIKKIKTIEPGVKTCNLNNSDSNMNYSEMYNVDKSSKSASAGFISNNIVTNDMHSQRITFTENCTVDINKVSNEIENNTVHNRSIEGLDSIQTISSDDNFYNPNSFSKNKINTSLDRSELHIINNDHNSSINNTSCVTVTHDNTLDIQISNGCDSLNNMEYLKISKVYEVITKDDEHKMVILIVSEKFNCLNIPSELNNVQLSDAITSSLITRHKKLKVTPEIESGELVNNEEILKPKTSSPKDYVEIKNDKVNRARKSPSIWNDSVHNYPTKHRGNGPGKIRHRQNKIYNKSNTQKYRTNSSRYHDDRPKFYTGNHYHGKREFCEDSVYDKYRYKHKDEKRRSNRDYSEGRYRPEENERYPTKKKILQPRCSKLNINCCLRTLTLMIFCLLYTVENKKYINCILLYTH